MSAIKSWLKSNPQITKNIMRFVSAFPCVNHISHKKQNKVHNAGLMMGTHVNFSGVGNLMEIGDLSRLMNCKITINGSNNQLKIGKNCYVSDCELVIEDSNGVIEIGDNTCVFEHTHLACIEGTSIKIGKNCLLSSDITFRTGDSHSILNKNNERINPSKNIVIEDHVWIGNKATVLKGVHIKRDSVVATGSIVTHSSEHTGCVIAGIPASVTKENISWCGERV